MNDMSSVIVPKSDQINADDLIGREMTITIRDVQIKGGQEQPVSIYFDGSDKAFRPCKGMSRVLVAAWGADAKQYVGRSLTLYRDPKVKWGGLEVGGIRIKAMSHIDKPLVMAIAESRAVRKPVTVAVLKVEAQSSGEDLGAWANKFINSVGRAPDLAKLNEYAESVKGKLDALSTAIPEAHKACTEALASKRASFATDDDDPFGTDQPTDHTGFVAGIERRIADAPDLDTLDAVQADLNSNSDNLPDDVTAGLDAKIAARKRALSKAQGGEG